MPTPPAPPPSSSSQSCLSLPSPQASTSQQNPQQHDPSASLVQPNPVDLTPLLQTILTRLERLDDSQKDCRAVLGERIDSLSARVDRLETIVQQQIALNTA